MYGFLCCPLDFAYCTQPIEWTLTFNDQSTTEVIGQNAGRQITTISLIHCSRYASRYTGRGFNLRGHSSLFVGWCFEPSQPLRITSGLWVTSRRNTIYQITGYTSLHCWRGSGKREVEWADMTMSVNHDFWREGWAEFWCTDLTRVHLNAYLTNAFPQDQTRP